MARRLSQNLNSAYIEAMNRLGSKQARHKIIAYVEGFDDVFFWSNLLRSLETEQYYFEVMLPSRGRLQLGKKSALQNSLGPRLGKYMIACVDADYDYLMQGTTPASADVCRNPYVFHTYVYSIENFQCYAPALHNVCVMSTLNDHRVFDFSGFLAQFSTIIHPLFAWNIWAYRHGQHKAFSMVDFYNIVRLQTLNFYHPERTLETLRHHVNAKIARLYNRFPEGKKTYKSLCADLEKLGVKPETTYLYMRDHDLFDGIVAPMLQSVCDALRHEREREIKKYAVHRTQEQNELASYQHSVAPVDEMLKKHTGYTECPEYQHVVADLRAFMETLQKPAGDEGTSADDEGVTA